LPKEGILSEILFFWVVYVFTICFIFLYSSINIIRSIIDIDARGRLVQEDDPPPGSSDLPVHSNGDLY
ncbi:hypothetical protein, partial [Deinococcus sp. Leaf326]|uniref:hypothetical protein n=1 Tax=Deinococcus sp. Leaf326 TaxID=1736338 RepID=UPI000A49DF96